MRFHEPDAKLHHAGWHFLEINVVLAQRLIRFDVRLLDFERVGRGDEGRRDAAAQPTITCTSATRNAA